MLLNYNLKLGGIVKKLLIVLLAMGSIVSFSATLGFSSAEKKIDSTIPRNFIPKRTKYVNHGGIAAVMVNYRFDTRELVLVYPYATYGNVTEVKNYTQIFSLNK